MKIVGKKIKGHPLLPPPGWEEVMMEAELHGGTKEDALMRLIDRRQKVIDAEVADPLRCGWEPSIWKVADALLGFDCYDTVFIEEIKARFGLTWDAWAERMRTFLTFPKPVTMLLILGGNRSSKSEYSAKRGQQILTQKSESNVYAFHMKEKRSIKDQQKLFWKYMPPEYKVQKTGVKEYIKHKEMTGFSTGSFINAIGSECVFGNYMQDRDTALEGVEADLFLPDELVPPDWIETMIYRLATRAGKGIATFTPIRGYSPTVKIFCDSAVTVMESVAFMFPKDGGNPDEARTLGITEEEYQEIIEAEARKRPARCAESKPDDCLAWLEGKSGQPAIPAGRDFEMMPRVMKPVNPKFGVVYFHLCDNPYGNPKEVVSAALESKKGKTEISIRVYGKAEKIIAGMFPKFNRRIHVIPRSAIPEKGTNYLFMDPAANRNFFLTWIRATEDAVYVYREWPGNYEIPGVGIPEPWAIPSGKKEGVNDGARGRGQESFGIGLLRYKFEMARLEGWKDWQKWKENQGSRAVADFDDIEKWNEWNGATEVMAERYVDSRAASNPRVEHDRPVTLFEDLQDIGMDFLLTPGSGIDDGVEKINTVLDYDEDKEQSFFNKPHLYISEDCVNTIFALENWTNKDGEHGACKDPIDNIRYYFTAGDTGYRGENAYKPRGGFYYGRGVNKYRGNGVTGYGSKGERKEEVYTRRPKVLDRKAVFRR